MRSGRVPTPAVVERKLTSYDVKPAVRSRTAPSRRSPPARSASASAATEMGCGASTGSAGSSVGVSEAVSEGVSDAVALPLSLESLGDSGDTDEEAGSSDGPAPSSLPVDDEQPASS